MKHFIPGKVVACDTETTGLRPWHGDAPFAFSFCNEEGETAYFEFLVDPKTRKVLYSHAKRDQIKAFFEDAGVTKVFHHARFDVRMLEVALGITVCGEGGPVATGGKFHDTMFMAHACNSAEPTLALKPLCKKYLEFGDEDQHVLAAGVRTLRRKAKKAGWKVATHERRMPDGSVKEEPQVEADYWIPRTAERLGMPWADPGLAGLCKDYAVKDAVRTMLLYQMYSKVMKDLEVEDTYLAEMERWPAFYAMETRGFATRMSVVDRELKDCVTRIKAGAATLRKMAGREDFNPESPKQVYELLYRKCKLKMVYTKEGKETTSSKALVTQQEHPTVNTLLKYRAASKAYGTFFAKYKELAVPDPLVPGGFCVHPGIRQVGPVTGRTACADPNLQQTASPEMSRSVEPIAARTPFGPRPEFVWLCVDYSGQEIRVYADVSDEPNMLGALERGEDIHSFAVQSVFGGPNNELGIKEAMKMLELDGTGTGRIKEVQAAWKKLKLPTDPMKLSYKDRWTIARDWLRDQFNWEIEKAEKSLGKKNVRSITKQVSFLKVYGGGVNALADLIKVDVEDAREILRVYDRAFPRMVEYSRELIRQARRDGCIRTRWNRRITVDPEFAYTAVNYMVQGTCADLLKSSVLRCYKYFRENDIDAHVLLPVHDEIIFEIRRCECTRALVRKICSMMSDSEGRLRVPMPVDPSLVTESWDKKVALKI